MLKLTDMSNKRNRLFGCSLNQTLKVKREAREARKAAQMANKAYSEAFVEAALWERRCRLRALENSHFYGLLETLTFSVLKAKTVEEIEKAKAEYYQFKRSSEARLKEKQSEVKDFVLYIDGHRKAYSVF